MTCLTSLMPPWKNVHFLGLRCDGKLGLNPNQVKAWRNHNPYIILILVDCAALNDLFHGLSKINICFHDFGQAFGWKLLLIIKWVNIYNLQTSCNAQLHIKIIIQNIWMCRTKWWSHYIQGILVIGVVLCKTQWKERSPKILMCSDLP